MEKYIALILLAAPGFIARHISVILGVTSTKKGEFETISSYLSYSFFAIMLTIVFLLTFGIVDLSDSWAALVAKATSIKFSIQLLIIALIAGVITGLAWALVFNGVFMKLLDWLNLFVGRNRRRGNGSLLNQLFDDGKEHFIIIRKDGRDIAVGFIYSASDPFDDKAEVSVTEYPEYRAELKKVRESDSPSPLRNTLQTYVDIENGIVITETEYPAHWLNRSAV